MPNTKEIYTVRLTNSENVFQTGRLNQMKEAVIQGDSEK